LPGLDAHIFLLIYYSNQVAQNLILNINE
jgi:hypothetical protein